MRLYDTVMVRPPYPSLATFTFSASADAHHRPSTRTPTMNISALLNDEPLDSIICDSISSQVEPSLQVNTSRCSSISTESNMGDPFALVGHEYNNPNPDTAGPQCTFREQVSPVHQRRLENRVIGRNYRERQRNSLDQLKLSVAALKAEHQYLLDSCYQNTKAAQIGMSGKYVVGNGVHSLSPATSEQLGIECLPGPLAMALLEIVTERRNISVHSTKRRTSTRPFAKVCPAPEVYSGIIACAVRNMYTTNHEVTSMLMLLAELHERWSRNESRLNSCTLSIPHSGPSYKTKAVMKSRYGLARRCCAWGELPTAGNGHPRVCKHLSPESISSNIENTIHDWEKER